MLKFVKNIFSKNRKNFIILSSVLLVIIGLINFYFIFEVTAQSNDECLWVLKKISTDSTVVVFDQVKYGGVTWVAGIRDGDKLLKINGTKIDNLVTASKILDSIHKGDFADYVVERNDKTFEAKIFIKKLINLTGFGYALLAFIWVIVGFIVVIVNPQGKTQTAFYKIGLYATLFALSNLFYRGQTVQNPIFASIFIFSIVACGWIIGAAYLPFQIIKFFNLFPIRNKVNDTKWYKNILRYIPAIIFIMSFLLFIAVFSFERRFKPDYVFQIMWNIYLILVVAGFIFGLVLLFISYSRLQTKQERNSIFVILIAYTVGVAALLFTYTLAGVIAGNIFNHPAYFMPIILIALLPVAFGYSIFKYSLLDVSDVVKNAIFYGTATLALAAIYFLLIYLIGQSVSSAIGTDYQGIIAGVIFIIFATIFQSTKNKFQDLITVKFYPEQFAFQSVLLKFSNDITTIVGFDNILDTTKKIFVDSLKLKHFGIFLKNEKKHTFELVRSEGIFLASMKLYDPQSKIDKYFAQKTAANKNFAVYRDEFNDLFGEEAELLIEEHIYTIIPLHIKSKLIGFLVFGLKYSGSRFAGKDIELLNAAANQTAVAIENARLYELETDKLKLEKELDNARKIQESLLPKSLPQIEHLDIYGMMIPAMQIGGDYYDFIQISKNKFFAVIADVSGKGLSASFYMSKIQTMVKLYCEQLNSPKKILCEINKQLFDKIERNYFITLSLALFDLDKKEIKICRAGHTPMILLREGKIILCQPGGIGLGLEKGEIFESALEELTVEMNQNDLYCLFSDGLTENMNEQRELYGMENLENVITLNSSKGCISISNSLLQSVEKFRGEAMQFDDITLILIKYF